MPVRPHASAARGAGRLVVPAFVLGPLLVVPGTTHAAAPVTTVTMRNFAFFPASVHITAGQAVRWVEQDTAPHDATVTAGPVRFASPMLTTGKSWSHTFQRPGTYEYICSIHPYMKAVVVVAKAGSGKPAPANPTPAAGTAPTAPAAPAQAVTTTTAAVAGAPDSPLRSLLLVLGIAAAGLLIPRVPRAVRAARR